MTVIMSILNMKGAWSFESPAPIEVTTATRLTSYFFMAAMTVAVPSVSMVGPTSFVLPPSEMMTPSTSPPSNTFSTSAAFVTEPLYLCMNQNFTAPYASDACSIARCRFRAPEGLVDLRAAFVLVELVVLDQFFFSSGAQRREELRRVAAERAHGDPALQELVGALSAGQAGCTEHGDRHLCRRAQRMDAGSSGGEEE